MTRNVAIIGAGSIAPAHIGALARRRDARVAAIVDPSVGAAEALGRQVGGAATYASVEALLKAGKPDAAHVLTPPPLHAETAIPLLEAGVDVLVEKPMAASAEECRAMANAAEASGAALAVNHNFTHHPAFIRVRNMIRSGKVGPVRRVMMRYAAPLRQMTARQFGHWMFNSPTNLLLEQAVHPLSQIDALLGGIKSVSSTPGPARRPADGIELVTDWALGVSCADGAAQLDVTLGASFPSWTLSVLCDDGVIDADIYEGRVVCRRAHGTIAPGDFALRNFKAGFSAIGDAVAGFAGFVGELSRLAPPADGFSRSITASVGAFYDALERGDHKNDGQGLRLVEACEKAARSVSLAAPKIPRTPPADARYDVAVFGGTGFIGAHLVRRLIDDGKRVAVAARNLRNLPTLFHHERVGLFRGSISDEKIVADVCGRSGAVVNLAHGGGGPSRAAIIESMVRGAETVARGASAAGADRLLYVSSSAALYLGDEDEIITRETPPDRQAEARADYACAKVKSEAAVRAAATVPFAILRPAIVVGAGGSPFHSALGAYENETHCQGWNQGRNPLPFVLVEDVASAIAAALIAPAGDIDGRAFNLVGDVRWSARRYTEELALATGRPLRFHPTSVNRLGAEEWLKWAVKKVAGRKGVRAPAVRDLKSRGMVSQFDIAAEKRILGWRPCADEQEFRKRAIFPHVESYEGGDQ